MFRRYEDPYKLQEMLEEAERNCDPSDPDDACYIEQLRERINFAWQDDEFYYDGGDY